MIKYRNEDGLTLIELLVVIALVGIISAISLPILLNTVETSTVKADAASSENVSNFVNDQRTAGFILIQGGAEAALVDATASNVDKIYAFDNDGSGEATGNAVAQITGVLTDVTP